MKARLILMIASMSFAAAPGAQVRPATEVAFDVAAIKPAADPTAFSFSMVQPGGRYVGQNV
jgi:hypothetical protein